MKQKPFLLKLLPGASAEEVTSLAPEMNALITEHSGNDFSLWQAEDMIFGYFEIDDETLPNPVGTALRALIGEKLKNTVMVYGMLNMRLMYDVIHEPAEDKSKVVSHRVFITRIKPGCIEEYYRLHQGLLDARRQSFEDGSAKEADEPSSNFTIWNAGDYICGYNEMTELPSENDTNAGGNEAWERHMLTLMDWLTDDADIFSGEKHEKIKRLY